MPDSATYSWADAYEKATQNQKDRKRVSKTWQIQRTDDQWLLIDSLMETLEGCYICYPGVSRRDGMK